MAIRLRRKRRKTVKLRGKRYSGYGQVSGGHRKSGQRAGFGRAGVKDHRKIELLRQGHIFGSRGFTNHGFKREYAPINIGRIIEYAEKGVFKTKEEHGKLVIDLTVIKRLKVLGGGSVKRPVKLLVRGDAKITERAMEKIKSAGGDVITVSSE